MGQKVREVLKIHQWMILDTNILIAHLNGESGVVDIMSRWKKSGRLLFVSSISVAEILALPAITPAEADRIKMFLSNFLAIPFDHSIAEIAAIFKRTYKLNIPDAAIAASAFTRNIPLVTRDRQFQKIQELTVVKI